MRASSRGKVWDIVPGGGTPVKARDQCPGRAVRPARRSVRIERNEDDTRAFEAKILARIGRPGG
jgi:hypothetical protein